MTKLIQIKLDHALSRLFGLEPARRVHVLRDLRESLEPSEQRVKDQRGLAIELGVSFQDSIERVRARMMQAYLGLRRLERLRILVILLDHLQITMNAIS